MTEPGAINRPAINRPGGHCLAYHATAGDSPGVVFLGGFMSDMTGTKAMALEAHCRAQGRAFLRFDYLGHGQSSGAFEDGTIGRWADDAIAAIDQLTEGPQVLVGSSMGGWIMLLAALALPSRVAGLLGVAAAPDFTESLIWDGFDDDQRGILMDEGILHLAGDYGDAPYPITRGLIIEARDHLLLDGPIGLDCPVRLIQGMADNDVPWQTALTLAERLAGDDVEVTLVKGGDHRLSEARDLDRLGRTLDALIETIGQKDQ